MLKEEVKIINRLGLHARAAAQIIRLAGQFNSTIMIFRPDTSAQANAKSILSILALSAGQGTLLTLEVEGIDEELAIEAISRLFANGFGELE